MVSRLPKVFVDTSVDSPMKSLWPVVSGKMMVRSSLTKTSGGIFPKAIRSLRRNNSFVEKEASVMAFGRSKSAADNFTPGIGLVY